MRRVRTIITGVAGSPWYVNMHFANTAGDAGSNMSAVYDFWEEVRSHMSSLLTIQVQREVPTIDQTTGQITGVETTGFILPQAGQQNASPLPLATQFVLGLRTGQYRFGRQVQGRIQIPGFTEIDNETGAGPNVATTGDVVTAATDNLIGKPDATLVVYSKANKGLPGVALNVSSVSAMTKWGVLRSRRD